MVDVNISLVNEHFNADLERALWEPGPMPQRIIGGRDLFDFLDVLVLAGIFTSRSQARKAGHKPEFPPGFTDVFMGKRRTRITIWNPVSNT